VGVGGFQEPTGNKTQKNNPLTNNKELGVLPESQPTRREGQDPGRHCGGWEDMVAGKNRKNTTKLVRIVSTLEGEGGWRGETSGCPTFNSVGGGLLLIQEETLNHSDREEKNAVRETGYHTKIATQTKL